MGCHLTETFTLHKQLATDTTFIKELDLCLVLLINDANYPWTVLVPKRAGATDIYKLSQADQTQLLKESELLSKAMESVFNPDKLNVAAIGNIVPQLHIHHIARYKTDVAWPAPVWGFTKSIAYADDIKEKTVDTLTRTIHEIDGISLDL